ncbi:glutaminase A [Gordonia sp. NPDC003504]
MTEPLTRVSIQRALDTSFLRNRDNMDGANADYIPALANADPTLFGLAVVTAAGDVLTAGDYTHQFPIESVSKVFTMALVMEQIGAKEFRHKIGADPTGSPFNSVMALELNNDKPLSPLVNAGAIATTSLVRADDSAHRWELIVDAYADLAGRRLQMSGEIYASEEQHNAHNKAIAWLLASAGNIYCDPMEACDVYTRQCSILVSTADLATMGATLANHGTNPVSGKRVLAEANVPHLLAEMTMEGLYTRSGDWAYKVGLPGKSGVGGGLLAIAPGELAIAAYSSRLGPAGNSMRGWAAITDVAVELGLGLYQDRRHAGTAG